MPGGGRRDPYKPYFPKMEISKDLHEKYSESYWPPFLLANIIPMAIFFSCLATLALLGEKSWYKNHNYPFIVILISGLFFTYGFIIIQSILTPVIMKNNFLPRHHEPILYRGLGEFLSLRKAVRNDENALFQKMKNLLEDKEMRWRVALALARNSKSHKHEELIEAMRKWMEKDDLIEFQIFSRLALIRYDMDRDKNFSELTGIYLKMSARETLSGLEERDRALQHILLALMLSGDLFGNRSEFWQIIEKAKNENSSNVSSYARKIEKLIKKKKRFYNQMITWFYSG